MTGLKLPVAPLWSDPSGWPFDPPGYVFLARAIDEAGRSMVPAWTGCEPGIRLRLDSARTLSEAPPPIIPLDRSGMTARHFHSVEQVKRMNREIVARHAAEVDEVNTLAGPMIERFHRVRSVMVKALVHGDIAAAIRADDGGLHPLAWTAWNNDNWERPFAICRSDGPPLRGWLYIQRSTFTEWAESLAKFAKPATRPPWWRRDVENLPTWFSRPEVLVEARTRSVAAGDRDGNRRALARALTQMAIESGNPSTVASIEKTLRDKMIRV